MLERIPRSANNGTMAKTIHLPRSLYRPAIPATHLRRAQLLELLKAGQAPDKKLTVVSAGPGYGKSTLVADYAAWSGLTVAWYAMDEGDSDPSAFLAHLI